MNACCYFVSATLHFKHPENAKYHKHFTKYGYRMKDIISGKYKHVLPNTAIPILSKNKFYIKALLRLILNAEKLSLEEKKDVINVVHDVLKYDENGFHPAIDLFRAADYDRVRDFLVCEYNIYTK